jgi:hypothetical protein
MNPNPHQARRARAERKQSALMHVRTALDESITAAREILNNDDDNLRLRAAHAISQISASYVRLYEAVEMESRLDAIEQRMAETASRN